MMKNKKHTNKKPSLFIVFVVLVFTILLISMAIASILSVLLIRFQIMPLISEKRFIPFLIYMLTTSLFTGTIIAFICGGRFFRQIKSLAELTKEVANGNFNVRMCNAKTKEVDLIANCFNEMVIELTNIETLRTDFVSNISHEFKTPISSIRGFARRLKKESLSAEQRNEYLDIIISESERLTRLSNNVLLLSRLESTEKVADEAEYFLDEQIRRTILLFEPQLQKKHLNIVVELETIKITTNEEMLNHVWINLLENAVKFSPDNGEITIRLEMQNENATVTIFDDGIGMDAETQKRIFDKFYQGDNSRTTEGNGLGLSLAKRILDLGNGEISVESERGKGTCFTVSLPLC